MENKITLSDLINKTPEEIGASITVENKLTIKGVKALLKNYFKDGNAGSIRPKAVLSNRVIITKVLPSTGRVFLQYEGKEFSVTKDYLTGEVTEFPFEVGDEVLDVKTNELGTVSTIIKSSRKVHVDFSDRYSILPVSRLQKMEKEYD